jgi:mannose-6-phosphate isomerase-like protein (cupin superfamily)
VELFRSVSDVAEFATAKMKKNSLFATERLFCDVYAFEPGQAQAAHVHAATDKVYYVLSGAGDFRVDGELRRLEPGAAVLCPAGSEHGVANPGPDRLTVLVFMSPPPSR